MIENCFHVLQRQIKRSRPRTGQYGKGKKENARSRCYALRVTAYGNHTASYLLCSLHMRIKNWEYKVGVLFRRRVVLLAPCLELINDYSYGPHDIAERRRDFSRFLFAHEFLDKIRIDSFLS